ncbi:MAG: hypothetical protein ACNA7J_15820, partial [Wenzhouxiangella sp.]
MLRGLPSPPTFSIRLCSSLALLAPSLGAFQAHDVADPPLSAQDVPRTRGSAPVFIQNLGQEEGPARFLGRA